MTPLQCHAARNLLGWAPEDLARAAGVSVIMVRNFEAGKVVAGSRRGPVLMRQALEGAGVRFTGGEGSVHLASR